MSVGGSWPTSERAATASLLSTDPSDIPRMKTPLLLASLALAGSATFVTAPAVVAPTPAAAAAAADTYAVDPGHSGALFRIVHLGVAPFWGRFNQIAGEYTLDLEDASSCSIAVTIAADSVDSNSGDRDNHIKSPDFFNVKEFPEIAFESTEISGGEDGKYRVVGDLTFHGITREVTAAAELVGQADTPRGAKSGFEATLTIDRNDFEVKTYPGALGDEVRIVIFVEGNKQ